MLLKFNCRGYAEPSEKWLVQFFFPDRCVAELQQLTSSLHHRVVASCVLRVYLALIESYVPDEGDFAQMPLELGGGGERWVACGRPQSTFLIPVHVRVVVGPQSSGAAAGGFQVIQTLLNEPSAASFRVIMYVLECGAERVNTQQVRAPQLSLSTHTPPSPYH